LAKRKDIKIIYDGEYPNLCSGTLIVYIKKERWEFTPGCLESGGHICSDNLNMWAEKGKWELNKWPEGFPDNDALKMLILDIINEEIPHGCCGGCI